ncbi:MAG: large-conductance mechanosensitive channel protein MscL [Flavobacteriales bacterium]|nr:large-conductance mechanosensitive channel protein MscL [Flavobacteriales bacterium]MCB9191579.1 large-conductance mechanosensitive channel protein MscL [Flavobacteriales bacterium]MCB9204394.1 large-conductance mechanosensitive channel protein MscL [Flavobacteriales bacterium]
MLKEFKEFAMKGNVMDMAIGIIIGGAFGKIVASFVADVLMPPLGLLISGVNFSDLKIVLTEAVLDAEGVETAAAVSINYGNFIQVTIDFIIIAFAIFMMVKAMNSAKKKEDAAPPPPPPGPTDDQKLLMEIRDLLKK